MSRAELVVMTRHDAFVSSGRALVPAANFLRRRARAQAPVRGSDTRGGREDGHKKAAA
jgi:hypothetical protein